MNTSAPCCAQNLAAGLFRSCHDTKTTGQVLSNARQHRSLRLHFQPVPPPVHGKKSTRASYSRLPRAKIASGRSTEAEGKTVQNGLQVPVLPLSLLGSLSAAWWLASGGSSALQCSTLLLLDIVYAGLHLQPLLPLFQVGSGVDVPFMHSYTKATYFVSECLLLGWLLSNAVIRASITSSVLALHGAVHVGFVALTAQVPAWCMQQQLDRIDNGWSVRDLTGKWHVLVNLVNFADLALHLCYVSVLWRHLSSSSNTVYWQQPFTVVAVGLGVAYLMARWFPQRQLGS